MYVITIVWLHGPKLLYLLSDETLSQVSATSTGTSAGVYEIPARLRTLHNLVIQYASQVNSSSLSIVLFWGILAYATTNTLEIMINIKN